ncbi:MAG: hypothetical protein HFJ96_00775 [Peptococcaceae bacterium]|jgi:hypothetical protein|nr:hypothetical protein [Peptococcaceae bacterium]
MVLQKEQADKIRIALDEYAEDPEIQAIYSQANFTEKQLKVLNILIVQAIRYYDVIKEGGEVLIRQH